MIDRRLLRDVAVAVMLAVPTIALAHPKAAAHHAAPSVQPMVEQASFAL